MLFKDMFQLTRKKSVAFLLLFSFSSALLLGRSFSSTSGWNSLWSSNSQSSAGEKSSRFQLVGSKKDKLFHTDVRNQESNDMLTFLAAIKGYSDSEELSELFDRLFSPHPVPSWLSHRNKQMILIDKWARTAPMQCLEKMREYKCEKAYIDVFFEGWASKDPIAAIEFYEEHYKRNASYKQHANIVKSLVFSYGQHSPEGAWNWLSEQKETISSQKYQDASDVLLRAIAWDHPDQLPDFLNKTKSSLKAETAYQAGSSWVMSESEFRDWLTTLPENARVSAEAGRIARITQGNLEKMQSELSQLPSDKKISLIKELANYNFNGSNQKGRIKWFLESIPEGERTEEFMSNVDAWMRNNDVFDQIK